MKKIVFVGAKGGVGKTTSAMLTAAALQAGGANVCVLDTDPQGSAAAWADHVEQNAVPLKFPVIPSGLNFSKQIPSDSEWVILDTPPGNPDIIRAALKWADLAVLPTRPGALDLIQLIPVLDESERSSTPAAVLLVQTRAGVKETDEIKEILADRQVMVIETQIPLRARTSRLAMAHPGARDLLASGYQDIANELKEAFQ